MAGVVFLWKPYRTRTERPLITIVRGGAGGYGDGHADPQGLAWHRLYTQHRNSSAAPAEVADPLAEVKAGSLASA